MDISKRSRRRRLSALLTWCLVLLLSWGLLIWNLDASDLTHDEVVSFHWASRTVPQMIPQLADAVREHPPTYYLLLRAWILGAGSSEYALRLLSVGFGMLSLTLTGWVARLALPSLRGLQSIVPVILLALTPGMVYYARVARMYQLVVLLPLASSGLFLSGFVHRRSWPRRASFVGMALVHTFAILTHYYLVLPMLCQGLLLLLRRRWKSLGAWLGAQAVPGVVALGWFLSAPGLQRTTSGFALQTAVPTGSELLHLIGKLVFSPVVSVRYGAISAILVLVGVGVVMALRVSRAVGVWLLLILAVPLAMAYAIPNVPSPRLLLFVLPAVALALGAICVAPVSLSAGGRRGVTVVLTLGATACVGWLLAGGDLVRAIVFERSNYADTLRTIDARARQGDVVLFYGPWQEIMLEYYGTEGLPPIVSLPEHAPPRLRPAEAEPVLRGLVERYERIWVLPAAVSDVDPGFYAGGWLLNNAHNVWEADDFALYVPLLPPDADFAELDFVFGRTLRLEKVSHDKSPIRSGEPVRLMLSWSTLREVSKHLQITVSLVDQSGHVWASERPIPGYWADAADTWAIGRETNVPTGVLVPGGAPPGVYALRLMVSDAATGTPLLADGENYVRLLDVEIVEPATEPALVDIPGAQAKTRFCSQDRSSCVDLVGFEPGGTRFQQGLPVSFTLHWVANGRPVPEAMPNLTVVHDPRAPWADEQPVLSIDLPSPWSYSEASAHGDGSGGAVRAARPVEMTAFAHRIALPIVIFGSDRAASVSARLITAPGAFVLPSNAITGRARVDLSVSSGDGGIWTTPAGDTSVSLFHFAVEKRPTLRALPEDLMPVEVEFGEHIVMRGYRVRGDASPGGELSITYAWYAAAQPDQVFSVFAHLTDPDGALIAQADGWPLEGRMPTDIWQPGEFIRDTHIIEIPDDAPSGPYRLYVGLYDAATGVRPTVMVAGDALVGGRYELPLPSPFSR